MSTAELIESAKKLAAYQAVDEHLASSAKFVGIGSGSTVVYVVEAIVAKGKSFHDSMVFIPTGNQSRGLIRQAGLRFCNLNERPLKYNGRPVDLDVAFDGADEIDEDLNLIKGGGGCLFQEKLVAVSANKFVAVAGALHKPNTRPALSSDLLTDSRKQSSRLCTSWKSIPIEVLPMSVPDVLARLLSMGSNGPTVRSGLPAKAGECVTDNGMWIIDAPFPPLLLSRDLVDKAGHCDETGSWEVASLAKELLQIPGVVEIGLFYDCEGYRARMLENGSIRQKPIAAYFGTPEGGVQVQRATRI